MKRLFSKLAVVLSLACTASMLHAQTPSIAYGRTTLQLSTFLSTFQGYGAVITDLNSNPLQNNSLTVQETGGALNLQTSAGEIEHSGGLLVQVAGYTLRFQNFIIDTTNPSAPVLSALFIVNNQFSSRLPLFNIQGAAGSTLPLQVQSGVLQENGLTLTLAPAAAAEFNSLFGQGAAQAGSAIGTANAYIVFSPTN